MLADRSVAALRTQPPFDASAMDGYAVRAADVATMPGDACRHRRSGGRAGASPARVGTGEAVRIFTGAPVPDGADAIVIQENVTHAGRRPDRSAAKPVAAGRHIRGRGLDFARRRHCCSMPAACSTRPRCRWRPRPTTLPCRSCRRPLVAILATGDELVPPGSTPGPDQIIASNSYGVAAIAAQPAARVLDLGIAPDDCDAIAALREPGARRRRRRAS